MKRWLSYLIAIAMFAACGLGSAAAQKEPRAGTVVVPPTNVVPQQYRGKRAHTNFLIFVPAAKKGSGKPALTGTSPSGETPASLSCIYQTWAGQVTGCPIGGSYAAPSGGTRMIAIVDAYDYPTALSDFNAFSQQFGLPYGNECGGKNGGEPCFQKTWPTTSQPRSNCSWAQEEALDIEWAHAMAPYAQIVLVEAASNSNDDLMAAVQDAANLVANASGGEVSMSWSGSESSSELTLDGYFTSAGGVSYFASSGDKGGTVGWPSTSPDVISAGGTTVNRTKGLFTGETVWSDAGGGPSTVEQAPPYQSSIGSLATLLNGYRGTPDISFDADPNSGVSVYDTTSCQGMSGWMIFGGTSVSSPSLAGIFNYAGAFGGGWDGGNNSSDIQSQLYQSYSSVSKGGVDTTYTMPFYDVTSGTAGSYSASDDWDFASGIGTLRGVAGITGSTSPSFSLSASPSSLSVTQGSSTTVTSAISMTASGGFSGSVDLTASAGSSGLTVSLSQSSISGNGTSTLNVEAGTATAGTYNVTVTGTGSDSSGNPLTSSTTVPVTVAQSSSQSFSLSASPSSLSVTQGSTTTVTSAISMTASGGFSGTVDLTASAGSSGLSISVSPTSISTGTCTLTVGAGTASAGTYNVTVTGTGTDSSSNPLSSSTTVAVTVAQPSSAGISLGASSTNITVPVNSSASDTITVTPSGSFTGSVTLSLSGLPPRTSSSFSANPVSITGTSAGSSILTITTHRKTTPGTYHLSLTAVSGSVTATPLSLTLVVGSTSQSFSLSASPSSLSVTQGSTTTVTSAISMTASGGFSGTVDLTASAGSSGLSISVSPTSISGTQTSTLTVGAGSATAGTYNVTVTGTGTDSSGNPLTSLTTVAVTVAQSSSGGSFSLSASPGNVSLHNGGTATYTITVTPSGGFDQTVSFQVSGALSGATISLAPVTGGSGSTTLSVTPSSGTKGSYTLVITGSTTSGLSQSVSVGLKCH